MSEVKKYIAPLIVFVTGMFGLLFFFLFKSAIAASTTQLDTDLAPYHATFWGLDWAVPAGVVLVIIGILLTILWRTAKAFLKTR